MINVMCSVDSLQDGKEEKEVREKMLVHSENLGRVGGGEERAHVIPGCT